MIGAHFDSWHPGTGATDDGAGSIVMMEAMRILGVVAMAPGNTGGTDHLSFDAAGVPGFQYVQDALDYGTRTHHSNLSTPTSGW